MQEVFFIHIPKTAGNSIQQAFLPYLDKINFRRISTANGTTAANWINGYSFCVVRNPFDRAVSAYHFHVKTDYDGQLLGRYPDLKSFSFKQYLQLRVEHREFLLMPQVNYISRCDGLPDVHRIVRFEALQEGMDEIALELGISLKLEHLNPSPRPENYRSFYDEQTSKMVAEIYADDLRTFHYSF